MRTRLGGLRDLACHLGVAGAVLVGLGLVVALHPGERPRRIGPEDPGHVRNCPICRSEYRLGLRDRAPGPPETDARPIDGDLTGFTLVDPIAALSP